MVLRWALALRLPWMAVLQSLVIGTILKLRLSLCYPLLQLWYLVMHLSTPYQRFFWRTSLQSAQVSTLSVQTSMILIQLKLFSEQHRFPSLRFLLLSPYGLALMNCAPRLRPCAKNFPFVVRFVLKY